MKKESPRSNWIWYLAGVLLCLTLVSVHLTSGLYARYCSTASGEDSARVARFNVTAEGELTATFSALISPGETVEKTVKVHNNSEVAITYTVSAENRFDNLPLTFSFTKQGAQGPELYLAAGGTAEFSLSIYWPTDNGKNDVSYSGKVDLVLLTLSAVQAD